MPDRSGFTEPNDGQEATSNRTARQLTTELAATPAVTAALADAPALAAEITRLRTALANARLNHANLAAAALATITAHRDGEPDPLSYVRDELQAQGHDWGRR